MTLAPAGYRLSTDPADVDVDVVHAFLTTSYWAEGVTRDVVGRSIRGSAACVSAFDSDGNQVGFCRAVSDRATFAYVADVFVLDGHRGRGLASAMVATLLEDPGLQGLRRLILATKDAHGLYERFGFVGFPNPERWMEKRSPG
jgi:GNAT superfamily N-acetyltransferase